jgi:hypothetical protein
VDTGVALGYGASAYDLAQNNGFEGTEEDWLASLHGDAYIKQTIGNSETDVMSQKATTDALDNVHHTFSKIGVGSTKFTIPAKGYHSSTIDRIPVDIKQGETYHVHAIRTLPTEACQVYEVGADGEGTAVHSFKPTESTASLVATKDIKEIGLYAANSSNDAENEVDLAVYADETVFSEHIKNKAVDESKATVEAVRDTFAKLGFNSTTFSVPSGGTHSSNADKIAVDIKQGETYTLVIDAVTSKITQGFQVFEVGSDGVSNSVYASQVRYPRCTLVATKDVKEIGIYMGGVTEDTAVTAYVFNEKTDFTENIKSQAVEVSRDTLGGFMEFNHSKNPQRYGFGYNAYLNPVFGSLSPDNGSEITIAAGDSGRLRSNFITALKPVYYECSAEARLRALKYNLDGSFVSADAWTGGTKGWLPSGYKYRFIFSNSAWGCPTREEVLQNVKIWCYGRYEYESKDFLLPEVADTAGKAEAEKELSFSFALVTDAHVSHVESYHNWRDTILSLANVNYLYPLDAIFSLGDTINGDIPIAESKEMFKRVRDDLLGISPNSFILTGNHDTNEYGTNTIAEKLSVADRYSLYGRYANTKVTRNGVSNYGYYDVDALKIRVIILDILDNDDVSGRVITDMGYSAEQVAWVRDVALDTEYQVIFLSHTSVSSEFNFNTVQLINGVELRNVIEAFIANDGTVVGMFHGHTHWDYIGKHSNTNGFYEVSTGTASCYTSGATTFPSGASVPSRAANTVTQELWDLVIVKPISRTVKMIRFGAGEDREFSY